MRGSRSGGVQLARDLRQAPARRMRCTDFLDEAVGEHARPTRPRPVCLGPACWPSSLVGVSLELVDGDQACARSDFDRLDERQDVAVEARPADPERRRRLSAGICEPLDTSRLANDNRRAGTVGVTEEDRRIAANGVVCWGLYAALCPLLLLL